MMHAYNELYLEDAMRNLGEALDFAWSCAGIAPDRFMELFIFCGLAEQFGNGNPCFVSGLSGTELALRVLERCGRPTDGLEAQTEYDCSPEYWCGWILAYVQWRRGSSFRSILDRISMTEILRLYPALHQCSEDRAADAIGHLLANAERKTHLQQHRRNCQLTQKKLSEISGVGLRSIQQYENRAKNINKAAGMTLYALSKALSCRMEDLLETETADRI